MLVSDVDGKDCSKGKPFEPETATVSPTSFCAILLGRINWPWVVSNFPSSVDSEANAVMGSDKLLVSSIGSGVKLVT